MCNQLPVRFFKIPSEGIGYKVFARMVDGRHNSLYFGQKRYEKTDKTGWIRWITTENESAGFCFFLKEEDAIAFSQDVVKCRSGLESMTEYEIVVRKIEYEGGLGEFKIPDTFAQKNYTITLCKAFRLLKKDE